MTSLYNLISKCFVVSKHEIFKTYPTNYDAIIWELFIVEVDCIRITYLLTYLDRQDAPLFDSTRSFHLSLSFIKVFSSLISAKPVSSRRLSM